LYMELYDGATGDIIARVIDAQAGNMGGFAEYLNRVTNTADADRILRRWAEALNKHLGDAEALSGK
jgi:cation transport regulator ChaC